ncbi:hypothetical protein B0T19DRAFT_276859 [Cercophora scortea]|uniref:NYN domain-containing protein n=1 Tax=Cercophora scortea TaxID=314031 RepID=A0AAE0I7F8_9PEZI|nr:hypothetical protein B0T19DRAFT_276859 [Cercophora scortea]
MSYTYFGTFEPDGRRLGSDLRLLAKWAETFATRTPPTPYSLSRLSESDQTTLFSKCANEFRLQHGPGDAVQLHIVQDGHGSTIDPELASMLWHPNYKRSYERQYEMCCAIEDASLEADQIAAVELKLAKIEGLDPKVAENRAKQASENHLVSVGIAVKNRWRKARREAFNRRGAQGPVLSPPTPEIISESLKVDGEEIQQQLTEPIEGQMNALEPKVPERHITPQKRANGSTTSACSSPTHGSETTVNSVSSGSPKYSDDSSPCSHVSSIKSSASATSHSGSFLVNSFSTCNTTFQTRATTETAHVASGHNHQGLLFSGGGDNVREHHADSGMESRLGTGLGRAFLHAQLSASAASHVQGSGVPSPTTTTTSTFAQPDDRAGRVLNEITSGLLNPYAAYHHASVLHQTPQSLRGLPATLTISHNNTPISNKADTTTPSTLYTSSFPIFQPGIRKLPLAKVQPYSGITCYDVPQKGTNGDILPEYWTTKEEKARFLQVKLHSLKTMDADLRSTLKTGTVARNPVHVFVDMSNIIIGFYDSLKMKRGIPVYKRPMAPAFSFENFNSILTRGRKVDKKVVAGSLGNSYTKRWPDYMVQAERLDYEMNILQRVPKPVSPQLKRKSKGTSREFDSATSGPDTSGDDFFAGPMKQGEQGVDEVLHLKILQSAMDTQDPGTIVLATGDAAHAEYSDGFKSNISRALAWGWNVELYGWSRNMSSAWRDPEFAKQWGHQFRIIELDDFCEELFDVTIESLEL